MAKRKGKLSGLNPVERSIFRRESGIARMRENIKRIREIAEQDVAEIEARIREKSILLDALKRGNLKV